MSKAATILVGVLGLGLIGETAYIGVLRRQVGDLRDRVDRVESKQRDAAPRAQLAKVEEQVGRVEEQVAEVKRRPAPVPVPAPGAAAAPSGSPALSTDEIHALIDQKVDEKVKAKEGMFGDSKKRPLSEVAKEAGLDDGAQFKMAEITDAAKKEVFDLLKTPRADGSNLVDELITAMTSGDPEKATAVWSKMFKENVPGTNETYFAAAIRISEETMAKYAKVLTPEQLTKYKHTGVGPLDLETGYDPFAEYWKQKSGQ